MPTREELKKGAVAVLLGGRSAEREVSLSTGRAMAAALSSLGYRTETVDAAEDVAARLTSMRPKAALVALHGRWGEDGCVQGLLECLGIPYTGSGVLASAVAMDKALTKDLAAARGVPVPEHLLVQAARAADLGASDLPFSLPAVVKPAREGSSVGITMVHQREHLGCALEAAAELKGPILIERFIKGREMSVAVLEGEALGVIEIAPARPFYDYEAKYGADSGTRYLFPAPLPVDVDETLRRLAEEVYEAIGCDGVCRADFMLDEEERPWFIEINTLPGMTETSLVPKIAAGRGISFEGLCERLLLSARLKA